ncbi:17896_t:CDS:2, partial [Cetraspora pellucida]
DWHATEKAKYIQEIKKEKHIPRKHANNSLNDEEDEEDDSSAKQTTHADNDNVLSAPRQNTILDWYFLCNLNPSYNLPSQDMVRGHNSGNSIYGFMALKENQETVVDILDLSTYRHTGEFLKDKLIEQEVNHFLDIFCETRWYSLAKVYMGVLVYEQGFRHCLSLSENSQPRYPKIENTVVKSIICDKYHFTDNDALTQVIKLIVDVIGRLESSDSTLADIFKELIYIHRQITQLDDSIIGLQAYALAVISKRAREFNSNIFFIALFLSPNHKRLAISKKIDKDTMIRASLELVNAWSFYKKVLFFCTNFTGNFPLLCRFAMKVFSIVPHAASYERLFLSLGLVKSKVRNILTPDNLSIISQLRSELKKAISTKKNKTGFAHLIHNEENADTFFYKKENMPIEELNEQLEEVMVGINKIDVMEEFFDFKAFERSQETFVSEQSNVVE